MNKNIEVINENLWAVEFDYVHMGYIKELSFNNANPSNCACLTHDGKMVLNKKHQDYKDIHRLMKIIMKFKNEQLGTDEGYKFFIKIFVPKAESLTDEVFTKFINSDLLKQVRMLFNKLSELEQERRNVHVEYIKKNKTTGIDKIKKIFKRKGV